MSQTINAYRQKKGSKKNLSIFDTPKTKYVLFDGDLHSIKSNIPSYTNRGIIVTNSRNLISVLRIECSRTFF